MKRMIRLIAVVSAVSLIGTFTSGSMRQVRASEAEASQNESNEKPESEMTEEEKAAKAEKEAREKALKEAYELPVQTNEIKNWPEGTGTYGDSAIVMDADSGAILYAKNIDKKEYPASITKVLTALLAFQYGNMEDTVTISDHALSCLGSGYTSIGLKAGDKISMEQALYATLLASANEAACAVGETVAAEHDQDYDWFIRQMNTTCKNLGGTNSNFTNTNGVYDENHYTCARDMALIGKALFDYPEFFTICQTEQYAIPASDTVEEHIFQQKHHMLIKDNKDYYEYAIAGKTGYTTEAENTLITLADNGERRLVCVVMRTYGGHTYSDTRALLEYGFQNFRNVDIAENEKKDTYDALEHGAFVVLPEKVDFDKLKCKVEIHEGSKREGTATYYYKDNPVGSCEVTVAKDYKQKEIAFSESDKKSIDYKQIVLICTVGVVILMGIGSIIAGIIRKRKRRKRRKRLRKRA